MFLMHNYCSCWDQIAFTVFKISPEQFLVCSTDKDVVDTVKDLHKNFGPRSQPGLKENDLYTDQSEGQSGFAI